MKSKDNPGKDGLLGVFSGTLPTITREARHRARVAVAARSTGADDCVDLLEMLGLRGSELLSWADRDQNEEGKVS